MSINANAVENVVEKVYLKDYQPPSYTIDSVDLHIDLAESMTKVRAKLQCRRLVEDEVDLVLDGDGLRLLEVAVDGKLLMDKDYVVTDTDLRISNLPKSCTVETLVEISPVANLALSGLYMSSGNYCTQCEPKGFRRITYFLDRSDVMSVYTCTICADLDNFPVLLANGNLVDSGELPLGKHWAKWHDPSKKPSYLFALVAGNFEVVTDNYVTVSGRKVQLDVFVESGKSSQAKFALAALQKAMQWDEKVYQREYDLDRYMIVAVSDFNFGAMENKGLNIFNDRYILAKTTTATDADFLGIETVVGHEYFHNWTGNRITLANWFQLCLKEGLTVFREQSFAEDITNAGVRRIEQAKIIETAQFAEDSGPMTHPVRPCEFAEINNFYTVTVYNKGAEVVRMLRTLLGNEAFYAGMQAYFNKYDGCAVTTEDFLDVMQATSGVNLSQFNNWYIEGGVVKVSVVVNYNAQDQTCELKFKQQVKGNGNAEARVIPIKVGFLSQGKDLQVEDLSTNKVSAEHLLIIDSKEQSFKFSQVIASPVLAVLREFSAPVKLDYELNDTNALELLAAETDSYVLWRTFSQLLIRRIKLHLEPNNESSVILTEDLEGVYKKILTSQQLDKQEIVQVLAIPSESYILEEIPNADIAKIHNVRNQLLKQLATNLYTTFKDVYTNCSNIIPYRYDNNEVAIRVMKNFCLHYLVLANTEESMFLCERQLDEADNMTDMMGVISAVVNSENIEFRDKLLADFYVNWKHDSLVIDKWLSAQALSNNDNALKLVKDLCKHNCFSWHNPNRVRALIGVFAARNIAGFHRLDGEGYHFLAEVVSKVDKYNAQLATRLCHSLLHWKKYDFERQKLMQASLLKIKDSSSLSKDLAEVIARAL